MFFFEKKNQKTFASPEVRPQISAGPGGVNLEAVWVRG
jgi:hypothetical protein